MTISYAFVAAFIIVVLLIICVVSTVGVYENYIFGFWAASADDFCDSAGVTSIMLFIGAPGRSGVASTMRDGYLVVMDDFTNQGFTMTYRAPMFKIGLDKYCIRADVVFDDEQIWDDTVTFETDISRGTMVIRSGDTVYARLYKQHDISNAAWALEN